MIAIYNLVDVVDLKVLFLFQSRVGAYSKLRNKKQKVMEKKNFVHQESCAVREAGVLVRVSKGAGNGRWGGLTSQHAAH